MIDFYEFGKIVIDGKTYTSDLIITPIRIIHPWWRKKGHYLTKEDLREILDESIEFIVIGRGFFGVMIVSDELKEFFREKNIPYFAGLTREATNKYNDALSEYKKVYGAFHLTC